MMNSLGFVSLKAFILLSFLKASFLVLKSSLTHFLFNILKLYLLLFIHLVFFTFFWLAQFLTRILLLLFLCLQRLLSSVYFKYFCLCLVFSILFTKCLYLILFMYLLFGVYELLGSVGLCFSSKVKSFGHYFLEIFPVFGPFIAFLVSGSLYRVIHIYCMSYIIVSFRSLIYFLVCVYFRLFLLQVFLLLYVIYSSVSKSIVNLYNRILTLDIVFLTFIHSIQVSRGFFCCFVWPSRTQRAHI